jgi:arsenate reductase (thioredoxin)
MTRVLFLCTHNSARSQMGEALLRRLGGDRFEVASAGTEVTRVHPLAVATMAAAGIDLGGHRSKHLDEFAGQRFDYLITVCDDAAEACPVFPGAAQRIHWSIPDPSAVTGSEQQRARAFADAADLLRAKIRRFMVEIGDQPG